MSDYRHNPTDPWEPDIYETGRTRPPKSHGGLIALLLIIVIFLVGLVSVLGVLNVRLFTQLQNMPKEEKDTLSIVSKENEDILLIASESIPAETEALIAPTNPDTSLYLNPSPSSVPNVMQEGGLSLQEMYAKNIDSVVSILCTKNGGTSSGTGVILTSDGYLVTNCHVVENAVSVTVELSDQRSYQASLVGADAVSDLAVLRIEAENLTSAEFGNSEVLQIGDSVVAIGDPLGIELRGTYTNGIISGINRDIDVDGRTMTLIQTTAALNSGNSGGPLINCFGQVIGINTMKVGNFASNAGVEGLGFAIPSTTVKEIVDQLIEQGYVSGRPTLGISGESVSTFYQFYYHMPAGLFITELDPESSAAKAGMETGDILISVASKRITNMEDLNSVLYGHEVGDRVNVVIYRSGQRYTVDLTLTESKG